MSRHSWPLKKSLRRFENFVFSFFLNIKVYTVRIGNDERRVISRLTCVVSTPLLSRRDSIEIDEKKDADQDKNRYHGIET